MGITVHHKPAASGVTWDMHVWKSAWNGNSAWDRRGTAEGDSVSFQFPDVADLRKVQFKYRSTDANGKVAWEAEDFVRHIFQAAPTELWTFAYTGRVLYQDPYRGATAFKAGDELTFRVITQNQFAGGSIYAWNPYDPAQPEAYFEQADRKGEVSLFKVRLQDWMTKGFHLKLMRHNDNGKVWEPDTANRVWFPCDGASLWLKSGQNDVRSDELALTPVRLEVLYPAKMPGAPQLLLHDNAENQDFDDITILDPPPFPDSPLFRIAAYSVKIYPGASYAVRTNDKLQNPDLTLENPPLVRPFPADPADLTAVSRFALGASPWLAAFGPFVTAPLLLQPAAASAFANGLAVSVAIGNARQPYQTVQAVQQPDGSWRADLPLIQDIKHCVRLAPQGASEPMPYPWIDRARYFVPTAASAAYYTHEGVSGISGRGQTQFADPPDRAALMRAAFGDKIAAAGIFDQLEMPHGVTHLGSDTYFVVHAPHAAWAALVLIDEAAPGGPSRKEIPMTLTNDTFYWWCKVPTASARPGTRYRFLLNGDLEVMDPAARAVIDPGTFDCSLADDPADTKTACWSVVLDADSVRADAHVQPWQTMGWENLLIYELHAKRLTDEKADGLLPLAILTDELKAINRAGRPGYLHGLPVTTLGLLPVSEFPSDASWGYNPALYFAIDSSYGGAPALAKFVNAAHASGRGVMLDLVYNHSLGSPLMAIAPDVYRNGDYCGDRMNCGHPMVREFLRQATIYLWRTFGLDGFRFDDTKTIFKNCDGGWEFLRDIHSALRRAASAEGARWPYCVAENGEGWNISDPGYGVMDGQWDIDEVYRIRDASYDTWHASDDHAIPLQTEMNRPQYWGRPFYQATRFGESHDMVSMQDAGNKRIAARPQPGEGLPMAKAFGTATLLSNGVPMLFMGQEVGTTQEFSFDNNGLVVNPQAWDLPDDQATDNTRVLKWFRAMMDLRNDPALGLRGDSNYQVVNTGRRTVAFSCGKDQDLFAVVTFGTPDRQQDSGWLGLPAGAPYKEIFNSSEKSFRAASEPEQLNGGNGAHIYSGQILNLPPIGAVVLQRA